MLEGMIIMEEFYQKICRLGVMVHTYNLSTWTLRRGDRQEFGAGLGYILSSMLGAGLHTKTVSQIKKKKRKEKICSS